MDEDTLPQWLYRRFTGWYPDRTKSWDDLDESDQLYWAHEAQAVRRAVARNGFKQPTNKGAQQ